MMLGNTAKASWLRLLFAKGFSWEFLNRLYEWCFYVGMWYIRIMALKGFQVRWHSRLSAIVIGLTQQLVSNFMLR